MSSWPPSFPEVAAAASSAAVLISEMPCTCLYHSPPSPPRQLRLHRFLRHRRCGLTFTFTIAALACLPRP